MSSTLGVHVTRGQQTLAELMCMVDRELNLAFFWTRRSTLGKSPILSVSGAQIKENSLYWALYPVLAVPSQGEVKRKKLCGTETTFGLLEKGCYLSSYTPTNVSRVINHISYYEWLGHYDYDDYIVTMQGLGLQIRAGASRSSGPEKLMEQINSTRISLAG